MSKDVKELVGKLQNAAATCRSANLHISAYAIDAAITALSQGRDGVKEQWQPDESWTAWAHRPPVASGQVECMRESWDGPLVWTVADVHPQTNVVGLYWRPVATPPAPAETLTLAKWVTTYLHDQMIDHDDLYAFAAELDRRLSNGGQK